MKLAKFLKTPFFTEEFRWLLLTFNSCFHRSSGQKHVWLSAIHNRFSWKKYLLQRKSRSTQRRCSVKEGMQRPAQVFSCKYCEIFKDSYFEKHLWTAGHRCFPVNFAKFLRTPFLQNTSGRLLLEWVLIYLTKTVLKKMSNCIFNKEKVDLEELKLNR